MESVKTYFRKRCYIHEKTLFIKETSYTPTVSKPVATAIDDDTVNTDIATYRNNINSLDPRTILVNKDETPVFFEDSL